MLRQLLKTTSLNNLSSKISGQIATILLLIMVALIILVMVTANIGQVSQQATTLANATDAAALNLGSQLSSKAYTISEQLRNGGDGCNWQRCCVKGGLLGVILAIILAVAAVLLVVLAGVTYGATAPAAIALVAVIGGLLAGALGGFIGSYAIQGQFNSSVAMGTLQGAAIGAAIGLGGASIAYPGVALGATTLGWGTTALAAASTVASIYNASVRENDMSAAMGALSRAINKLPEIERIREGAFLTALSQAVDDPTTVIDTGDVNENGKTTDVIPRFAVWYHDRIQAINDVVTGDDQGHTENYINLLTGFRTEIANMLRELDRQEIECPNCPTTTLIDGTVMGTESPMINFLRILSGCGYNPGFYIPGPSASDLAAWYRCSYGTGSELNCDLMNGALQIDQVDLARVDMEEFFQDTRPLINKDIEQLKTTYNDWIGILDANGHLTYPDWVDRCGVNAYTSDETDEGLVDELDQVSKNMVGWSQRITEMRNNAPRCMLKYGTNENVTMSGPGPDNNCGSSPLLPGGCGIAVPGPGSILPYCHWTMISSPRWNEAYYSNYPCRIKSSTWGDAVDADHPDEAAALHAVIKSVRDAADGIEGDVKEKHKNDIPGDAENVEWHFDDPNNPTTAGLKGTLAHKCYPDGAEGDDATLSYTINYRITYTLKEPNGKYSCDDDFDDKPNASGKCGKKGQYDCSPPHCTQDTDDHDYCFPDPCGTYATAADSITVPNAGSITVESEPLGSPGDQPGGTFYGDLHQFDWKIDQYSDPFIPIIQKLTGPIVNGLATGTDSMSYKILGFVNATTDYVNYMKGLAAVEKRARDGADWPYGNGIGSPSYSWTDSRGTHTVSINTGAWIPPKTHHTTSGRFAWLINKKCVRLTCYQEPDSNDPTHPPDGNAWIEMTRTDSTNQPVQGKKGGFLLWSWNPVGKEDSSGGRIRRKAWAGYDHNGGIIPGSAWRLYLRKTER